MPVAKYSLGLSLRIMIIIVDQVSYSNILLNRVSCSNTLLDRASPFDIQSITFWCILNWVLCFDMLNIELGITFQHANSLSVETRQSMKVHLQKYICILWRLVILDSPDVSLQAVRACLIILFVCLFVFYLKWSKIEFIFRTLSGLFLM